MKIDASKLRRLVESRGLTNTTVALQAGISRQALQLMLRENRAIDVREKTAKGLARALGLPDEGLLSPDPLLRYKEALAGEHADLTFHGLGLPATLPLSMDELHVDIRVIPGPGRDRDSNCQGSQAETETIPLEEADELTVVQCLALYRRALISGEPGSGKTTTLRYIARQYARRRVADDRNPNQALVPLLVPLVDFARARERDLNMNLVRFVVTRTLRDTSPEYWAEVEHQINLASGHGGCVVMLDGLDEVGGDKQLIADLLQFIKENRGNQFVVTSRIVGLDEGPWLNCDFTSFQVARWRDEDIRAFAQRWYSARPEVGKKQKKQNEQRVKELTTTILSHRPLRAIASNPLMLTILAALHHANAALPRRRVDLYTKIVEVMLETWEASKRTARPGDPLHGIVLEAREFGWLLGQLALSMQREGCVLQPRWWVSDSVQQFLREQLAIEGDRVKEQGERVIRYLCERTSLLVERGNGIFGFFHRSFQEYFAAQGSLLEVESGGDIVTVLRPYLFHPQWEEVIIYVVALLSAPRATTLLRAILDDPDPAGRFLRRGQRLALRCLVDGAAVADHALLDQIFSDANAIGGSRWIGITIEFIRLLKQLRCSRHEDEARRVLGDIEEAAENALPDDAFFSVYRSLHRLPNGPREDAPGAVCRKRLGGRTVELMWSAPVKRIEDPDAWYTEVLKLVRNPRTEIKRRFRLISFLAVEADSNDRARRALKQLLLKDRLPEIRARCAEALGQAVSSDPTVTKLLLERLDKDSGDLVRAECAEALRSVAPDRPEVRCRLAELFASGPERLREGAALGLSRLDFTSPAQKELLGQFLDTIASPAEPARVRWASLAAIDSLIGRDEMAAVDRVVEQCLDDPNPKVHVVALRVLADAIVAGRKEWSPPLIEMIETMLMAVTDPCPHIYSDLVGIVALKELHGGRRLERLLGDALSPFSELIRLAFVFGSIARLEQVRESDVDLMIVGDVRLKDLAPALHLPEQILGRTVNPVLFSAEKFREQYREGNPFLIDVVRKEKIFLKGSRNELTELVADQ